MKPRMAKGWGHKRGDLKMPFSTWKSPENNLIFFIKVSFVLALSCVFHDATSMKNAREIPEKNPCLKNLPRSGFRSGRTSAKTTLLENHPFANPRKYPDFLRAFSGIFQAFFVEVVSENAWKKNLDWKYSWAFSEVFQDEKGIFKFPPFVPPPFCAPSFKDRREEEYYRNGCPPPSSKTSVFPVCEGGPFSALQTCWSRGSAERIGVMFLFWSGEFEEKCWRILRANFSALCFQGFRPSKKIHAQNSRPNFPENLFGLFFAFHLAR